MERGASTGRAGDTDRDAESDFVVYTQNAYLGGDTAPLFTLGDLSDTRTVAEATASFWAQVGASDPPARVERMVDRIASSEPHVVALQELFRFEVSRGDAGPIETVDLLELFEQEIARRGLPYETAVVHSGTSSSLPLRPEGTEGDAPRLAFTDRIAMLKRLDVPTLGARARPYGATGTVGPIDLVRGWVHLTVDHGATPLHVVATHLELQSLPTLHLAQAEELRTEVLPPLDGVTILLGDLNSDAAAGPGRPSWTPTYEELLADGFLDAWTASCAAGHSAGPGSTCCRSLEADSSETMHERIDFVLVRAGSAARATAEPSHRLGDIRARVVGTDPSDRTPGGLWPSDHAGLVATIRIATAAGAEPGPATASGAQPGPAADGTGTTGPAD